MKRGFFAVMLLLGSVSVPKRVLGLEELSPNDPERYEKTIERFRSRQMLRCRLRLAGAAIFPSQRPCSDSPLTY